MKLLDYYPLGQFSLVWLWIYCIAGVGFTATIVDLLSGSVHTVVNTFPVVNLLPGCKSCEWFGSTE
jgi:hypothetical protein